MRILILAFILIVSQISTVAAVPTDKVLHFSVSYGMTHLVYSACTALRGDDAKFECLLGSAAGTLLVGALKEVADGSRNSKTEHAQDMMANTAGVLGAGVMISITW